MLVKSDFPSKRRLLTIKEVAEKLNIHKDTVGTWLAAGYFPHHKLGSRIRVDDRDLDEFIENGRRN